MSPDCNKVAELPTPPALASATGSAPLVELQRTAEAYERDAAECWQLVDEYTAMAERAQDRAEEAYQKLQDAMAQNEKLSDARE